MNEKYNDELRQHSFISVSQEPIPNIALPSVWPISFEISTQKFSYADEYINIIKTYLRHINITFLEAKCEEYYDVELIFSLSKYDTFLSIELDIHTKKEIVYSIDYHLPPDENKALISEKIRNMIRFLQLDLLES